MRSFPSCSSFLREFGNLEIIAMLGLSSFDFNWTFVLVGGDSGWHSGAGFTPYNRLSTWARGGPGGSNITVTILVLSALNWHSLHRSKARSTSLFDGFSHLCSPWGLIMCLSLFISDSETFCITISGLNIFHAPSVAKTRHLVFQHVQVVNVTIRIWRYDENIILRIVTPQVTQCSSNR